MRHRNTLLAGIAALALIAGTGIASSQEAAKDQKAATQGKQPHAATEPMNHGAPGYTAQTDRKIGPSAQDEKPATGATRGNRAEEMGHLNKAEPRETNENKTERKDENKAAQTERKDEDKATQTEGNDENKAVQTEERREGAAERREGQDATKGERERTPASAERENRDRESATFERRRQEGNAWGMNVRLSSEQRTEIRSRVIEAQGAPRVTSVNFNIAVGTVVPRDSVEIVPVPETLVEIEPEWRGFLYFVYEDDVVIVNPGDMKIIAVVAV